MGEERNQLVMVFADFARGKVEGGFTIGVAGGVVMIWWKACSRLGILKRLRRC